MHWNEIHCIYNIVYNDVLSNVLCFFSLQNEPFLHSFFFSSYLKVLYLLK